MSSSSNQHSTAKVRLLVLAVVFAVIALVGWIVFEKEQTASSSDEAKAGTQQAEMPEVNSASDLKNAEDFVNGTDVDGQLDTSELDEALSEQYLR